MLVQLTSLQSKLKLTLSYYTLTQAGLDSLLALPEDAHPKNVEISFIGDGKWQTVHQ